MPAQGAPESKAQRDGAPNRHTACDLSAHDMLRAVADAASAQHREMTDELLRGLGAGHFQDHAVAFIPAQRQRRGGHTIDAESLHLHLRKRAAHAVGIQDRQPQLGANRQRDQRIRTARLESDQCIRAAADVLLQHAQGGDGL